MAKSTPSVKRQPSTKKASGGVKVAGFPRLNRIRGASKSTKKSCRT